jgi:hypothetical protein
MMFELYPGLMLLAIFLSGVEALVLWCRFTSYVVRTLPAILCLIIFLCLFYLCRSKSDLVYPLYFNPFGLIVIIGNIPLGLFVGFFAYKQLGFISKGVTAKQYESVTRETMQDREGKISQDFKINKNLTCQKKTLNVYYFLLRKQQNSLIAYSDL